MGFGFDDILKAGAAIPTGGLSELDWGSMADNGYRPAAFKAKPPLQASGVALPGGDLADTFAKIGTNASGQIGTNYNNAMAKSAADAKVQGFGAAPLDYTRDRMSAVKGLDLGNLETNLGGLLGETGYNEAKELRGYNQNMSLVDQIAAANKPSLLDQIFSGIGQVGGAGGKLGGLRSSMQSRSGSSYPTLSNDPYSDLGEGLG